MKTFMLCVVLFIANMCYATECPHHFKNGIPPSEITAHTNTTELCFDGYAVLYSLDDKISLWSAEVMTKDKLHKGDGMKRHDDFHAESRLPVSNRATLKDYDRSGYDRGHLTPYKNIPWDKDIDSLANIVPQASRLNRGAWSALESAVRTSINTNDVQYVITGAICYRLKFVGYGVCVPEYMYKVVGTNEIAVFVSKNENTATVEQWSIEQLEKETGFKFFDQ